MRDNFRVRLAAEYVSFALELFLELHMILHDSVVHHCHAARAIRMWMRICLRRTSVRCPARMSDSVTAMRRILFDISLEIGYFPRSPAYGNRIISIQHRDTG